MKTLFKNNYYTYKMMQTDIKIIQELYQFVKIFSIGKSILGKDITALKIGTGPKEVFYFASIHANEWITTPLLIKFIEEYCYAYSNNLSFYGYNTRNIYNNVTLYIVPMVNPDGVDLVTGQISLNSFDYKFAQNIANDYPSIPFPSGWKSNIRGVDLNLQFPAGWEQARQIKYSQGFTSPAPRDFVGYDFLVEPEALALYHFTLNHNFRLVISYHTQGKEIYWKFKDFAPAIARIIGQKFENVSGYKLTKVDYNSSFAGFKDWFIQHYKKPGYTIEAGIGQNPLPVSQFNEIYQDNIRILILGMIL